MINLFKQGDDVICIPFLRGKFWPSKQINGTVTDTTDASIVIVQFDDNSYGHFTQQGYVDRGHTKVLHLATD